MVSTRRGEASGISRGGKRKADGRSETSENASKRTRTASGKARSNEAQSESQASIDMCAPVDVNRIVEEVNQQAELIDSGSKNEGSATQVGENKEGDVECNKGEKNAVEKESDRVTGDREEEAGEKVISEVIVKEGDASGRDGVEEGDVSGRDGVEEGDASGRDGVEKDAVVGVSGREEEVEGVGSVSGREEEVDVVVSVGGREDRVEGISVSGREQVEEQERGRQKESGESGERVGTACGVQEEGGELVGTAAGEKEKLAKRAALKNWRSLLRKIIQDDDNAEKEVDNAVKDAENLDNIDDDDDEGADEEESVGVGAKSVEAAPEEVEEGTMTFHPDMNLRTFMEEHGEFTVSKVTQRSSLSGDMKKFREALTNLDMLDDFKSSVFGHLLGLSDKAIFPPKLVHGLRLRTIKCKKTKEVWVKFNNLPARFGLKEFALMTGLSCHDYPSDVFLDDVKEKGQPMWDTLIEENGGKKAVSGSELLRVISEGDLDARTKFRLSLAWFAHSILCSKDARTSVDPLFVMLAHRPTTFFAKYPWGRKSFEMTIQSLVKPMSVEMKGYNLYGFPWAFVAWAYEAIPSLRHPEFDDKPTEPRMIRWIPTKQERECDHILRHVDNPVVSPFLLPTPREKRKAFMKNLLPFVDEEDELIDQLTERLKGAQNLRLVDVVGGGRALAIVGVNAEVVPKHVDTRMDDVTEHSHRSMDIVPEQSERRIEFGREASGDGGGAVGDNVVGDILVGMSADFIGGRARENIDCSGGGRRLFEQSGGYGGEAGESTSIRHGCSRCSLCEACKEEKENEVRLLKDLKESVEFLKRCAEEKPKRTVYPSRAQMSPFVASLKKARAAKARAGKATRARGTRARAADVQEEERLPVDLYRPVDPAKEAVFNAYMKEKKREKRPFLGHEYNYLDFQDVIRMKKWMESQHVDEILNLMRVRHKEFHRHYNKTDVILDMNFCTRLTAAHQAFIKDAEDLGVSFDECMNMKKCEEGLLDYASGKLPYPGGRKWDGAKRIFTVLNIDNRHYLTCVFLIEQGKIELYDCNMGVYSEDALAPYVLPITIMFPKFLRDCGKFKHLPEAILNADLWGYERVPDLPRNETGTACGGYSLMFMEHLLTNTPMTLLHDSSMEDMRKKWAVDIFYEEMEP